MDDNLPVSDQQLLALLDIHQPIKSRKLALMLKDEFGFQIDRTAVNSHLYQLRSKSLVTISGSYQWGLTDTGKALIVDQKTKPPSIEYTQNQQAIVDLDPAGHLLVRGQAGSGKTLVLLARAAKTRMSMSYGSVLFLTYNTALAEKIKQELTIANVIDGVNVLTYHEWCKLTATELGVGFSQWIDQKQRKKKLAELLPTARIEMGDHRLYDMSEDKKLLDWYGDEIAWLFGQHIQKLHDYETVERKGRGTMRRLARDERKFVWAVFEMYEEWLESENAADYDNPAGLVLRSLMQSGKSFPESIRRDHVLIDEVQDFDRSWLLPIPGIARVSLTLAGDLAQRIYKRSFTWASVGIRVSGARTRSLDATFRSTRQILGVAENLLSNNDIKVEPGYTPPEKSLREGEKVLRIECSDARNAYEAGYDWIAQRFGSTNETVAVALPFSNQVYPAKKALEKRGISAKAARGASLGAGKSRIVTTTYHQLKGLEFDHVVILGLHDNQFPGRLVGHLEEDDLQQENSRLRRLLYVAMTRARHTTTLVGSTPFCRYFDDVQGWWFNVLDTSPLEVKK